MMRRSRRTRLGRRSLIGADVEGGGDQGAEVEVVVGSGVGGEGVVEEASRNRIYMKREAMVVGSSSRHGNFREHGIRFSRKQS